MGKPSPSEPREPMTAGLRCLLALGCTLLLLASCSHLGFYSQGLRGGAEILCKRQSIERLLREPATDPDLRDRLVRVRDILSFAEAELSLKTGGSYSHYTALDRPYALWNVVATPEFSLAPVTWCFPIAGCVGYRGYFHQERAERFAQRLRDQGFDVAVGGVPAYSTLGWFKDPVLSTFVDYPEPHLAGLLFHELAHQRLYFGGDTTFDESFATAVELEGVRRWLHTREDPKAGRAYRRSRKLREAQKLARLRARDELETLYLSPADQEEKRRYKTEVFHALEGELRALAQEFGLAGTTNPPLNNANLAGVASYEDLVPAFQRLLAVHGGSLEDFFSSVDSLRPLSPERRRTRLQELSAEGPLAAEGEIDGPTSAGRAEPRGGDVGG